jgi:hypothetical protein
MNAHFLAYIELGKSLANEKGLRWEIALDEFGMAVDSVGWNLTSLVGDVPPPVNYLRDLGTDSKSLAIVNLERIRRNEMPKMRMPLSSAWQDLVKAAMAEQLLFKRNATASALQLTGRPLRVIASCVEKEPWELTVDDFRLAARIAKAAQSSGHLCDQVIGAVKVVFDAHHICDAGPLYSALAMPRLPGGGRAKARHVQSRDELRANLESRKRSDRLPLRRAFWELTRIVMTEKPRTFMDDIRFAALRVMIVTGFRAGEAALLPTDWRRERSYVDSKGRPAGQAGGISTSVMIRHFAEKQQIDECDSRVLFEKAQPVPEMFLPVLEETLEHAETLTEPMRATLKLQCESNRLLPWYGVTDIVPVSEIYTRITGHPFWTSMPREPSLSQYKESFDPEILGEIYRAQNAHYASRCQLDMAVYLFCNRLQKKMKSDDISLRFRRGDGSPIHPSQRMSWPETFLQIGELESYIRQETPTKVPDMLPMPLAVGAIQPWEFLFVHPKRSLAEERNDGICDISRYISIGRPDTNLIMHALGEIRGIKSVFEKYGATDEDRGLMLESHMLRHLQNTELFRLGVADTIISKRFNRRSVAQSYDYDHRSLAEDLDQIEIPEDVEIMLGSKASTVARLIKAGKANGPIVDAFRRIQATDGDTAAYEYLRIEADGFHATPYGHCLNSFTVDPCPKHLECFSGCRHLSATDLPENRTNLLRLENKFQIAVDTIRARPAATIGWKNQLDHAQSRLSGVKKLLETPNNERPFPDGPDLSLAKERGVLDD